jgi:hypothetical protein
VRWTGRTGWPSTGGGVGQRPAERERGHGARLRRRDLVLPALLWGLLGAGFWLAGTVTDAAPSEAGSARPVTARLTTEPVVERAAYTKPATTGTAIDDLTGGLRNPGRPSWETADSDRADLESALPIPGTGATDPAGPGEWPRRAAYADERTDQDSRDDPAAPPGQTTGPRPGPDVRPAESARPSEHSPRRPAESPRGLVSTVLGRAASLVRGPAPPSSRGPDSRPAPRPAPGARLGPILESSLRPDPQTRPEPGSEPGRDLGAGLARSIGAVTATVAAASAGCQGCQVPAGVLLRRRCRRCRRSRRRLRLPGPRHRGRQDRPAVRWPPPGR